MYKPQMALHACSYGMSPVLETANKTPVWANNTFNNLHGSLLCVLKLKTIPNLIAVWTCELEDGLTLPILT